MATNCLTTKPTAYAAQTKVKALQGGAATHDANRSLKTEDSSLPVKPVQDIYQLIKPMKYVEN